LYGDRFNVSSVKGFDTAYGVSDGEFFGFGYSGGKPEIS
jgi:hypothetical protein